MKMRTSIFRRATFRISIKTAPTPGPVGDGARSSLPQMEENAIYQTIHFDLPIESPMNGVRVANIPSFLLPHRRYAAGVGRKNARLER